MSKGTTAVGGQAPTNGAKNTVELLQPYTVRMTIEGKTPILFHRWNVEGIEEKALSSKGSKARKTDDVETYVYRNEAGEICLPGEYLWASIVKAAKFRQDPRSPRKSAEDLFKAAISPDTLLATLGKGEWDYEDRRRVVVQRAGITRTRPAFRAGWRATLDINVNLPEYVTPEVLHETVEMAGRVVGVGDFRPTYGRFRIVNWTILGN